MLDMILNSLLLAGILCTAILTIFKAGKWFGAMINCVDQLSASVQSMSASMVDFRKDFDNHTDDENRRFRIVEETIEKHGEKIDLLRVEIANLVR